MIRPCRALEGKALHMARDAKAALVALNRFGLGARGGAAGDLANAAYDPRGYLKAELQRPGGALLDMPGLLPTPVLGQALFAYQDEIKRLREAAKSAATMPADQPPQPVSGTAMSAQMSGQTMPAAPTMPAMTAVAIRPQIAQPTNIIQKTFRAEALARIQRATIAESGFVERLVTFWSNHFCISANKGEPARIWAGSFEREAIRPHVLGRYADMLKAVEQHPAMLFFLDNQQSFGPDSQIGRSGKRGLNENLAREIMELHTLGVGGGYTQDDVTSLARMLTGWTFSGRDGKLAPPGSFVFFARTHQPGAQQLLGRTYPDGGLAQGEAALADFARQPATAAFIARKFAHHFGDPPPQLVALLENSFRQSDGDLRALALTLIDADDAWTGPLVTMRSPYEFLIATGRLLARIPEDPGRYIASLNVLGQPLWTPAGPNGFPDGNAAWAAPEGLKLRLDIAVQVASRLGDNIDPRDLLTIVAGDAASEPTRDTVAKAESRQQGMALLLMSPEFQRR